MIALIIYLIISIGIGLGAAINDSAQRQAVQFNTSFTIGGIIFIGILVLWSISWPCILGAELMKLSWAYNDSTDN